MEGADGLATMRDGSSRAQNWIMASLTVGSEPEARRVALVTAAAVRIGRAIGLALGGAGMSVVVHYRRSEAEAAQLCEELARRGVHPWSVRATSPIRSKPSASYLDEARALVTNFVEHYNTVRLHTAIGYITPADFLASRGNEIWAARDRSLARQQDPRRPGECQRNSECPAPSRMSS